MTAEKPPTAQLAKLGIHPGTRWLLYGAPADWQFEVAPEQANTASSAADVVIAFVTAAEQIRPTLARLERVIFPAGSLWIAWPRKATGHVSDVTDTAVREAALARTLVDTKVAAIDADWSGLKLVWRVSARG